MTRPLIILALLWIAWCVVHSLLVAGPARRWLETRLGRRAGAYRLLYNLFALVTLAPVLLFARGVGGPVLFHWWGAGVPVGAVLLISALAFFRAGSRAYDLSVFLGVRQMQVRSDAPGSAPPVGDARSTPEAPPGGNTGLHATGGISREGVLGLVRHPWYTGGILLLWVGPKNAAALVTATVLTLYLILGAFLEERRLEASFGEEYRRYRREVSMFLPFRWLRRRAARRA